MKATSRGIAVGAAVLATFTGLCMTGWAMAHSPGSIPPPPAQEQKQEQKHSASAAPSPSKPAAKAEPARLVIGKIGVDAPVSPVGLQRDGSVQVPPLAHLGRVGWYRYGPAPGERGPAVLLGHVDSGRGGPGVFFRLHALKPGDPIRVTRSDRTAVRFQVTSVEDVPKQRFPTARVYGDLDHAGLRLITCGGTFDRARASYTRNIIVWARRSA
ncbi:class F sortase [Actinomadura barringtoniae]|uniref:Class F sortase n=1 Tax=Actinomadura barringtoniae TaxID=1427535 RepID=A0A939PLA5_9ACTN|nr:class F sortase [Actinomadura barringtoniae]MBO2452148.1 class F sortase [Actinomadura barringtoniae]